MPDLYGRRWTRRELEARVGAVEQLAGVDAVVADDGRERGSRELRVRAGDLDVTVLVDRALDLGACSWRGVPLAWRSPAGGAHPAYTEPGGAGWLRSFGGGLLTTCGLDQFGAPNRDAGEAFGLHGRASSLPAENVRWSAAWRGDEYEIEVRGRLRQARLFGENLRLERTIRTRLGAPWLELEDEVVNDGFEPQPHMILYHCNLGFPLVAEDSRLRTGGPDPEPRDADARAALERWSVFGPPESGLPERVFRHAPRPGADGFARVRLESPRAGLALELAFDAAALPHLYQWTLLAAGGYVLGLEPANCAGIEGRAAARAAGALPVLAPGEARRYRLRFEVAALAGYAPRPDPSAAG